MSRLNVHRFGLTDPSAPALVLLHGYTDSGETWTDAVERWAPDYRVLAPDALGHGTSPRYSDEELVPDPSIAMIEATTELLEELAAEGTTRVALIGHSMGGRTAATIAGRRPDLLRAAVAEDPAWVTSPKARQSVEEFAAAHATSWITEVAIRRTEASALGWPASEIDAWVTSKLQLDYRFGAGEYIVSPDPWEPEVRALAIPTLIVTGDRDVIVDSVMQNTLRDLAPAGTEIAVIPGTGHAVRREGPDAYHAVVDTFLVANLQV